VCVSTPNIGRLITQNPSLLAEQHRIVDEVDELMALCDRLETAQAERESRRNQLTAASHHHLNKGADGEIFREHAKFHIGNLRLITTRPDQIKQLRQTILSLAIRGTLVPPDPNDEPASKLLNRIRLEEQRLIEEGTIRKQKAHPPLSSQDTPFSLPVLWEWVRLSNIADVQDPNPSHRMPHYEHSGGGMWLDILTTTEIFAQPTDTRDTEKLAQCSTSDLSVLSNDPMIAQEFVIPTGCNL